MSSTRPPAVDGYSPPKRAILTLLKRGGELSLKELAGTLGVSRVAVLRHLARLEQEGLVERNSRIHGRGRPSATFRLTNRSQALFPAAYAEMSVHALRYIDHRLGRPAVADLLRQRAGEIQRAYRSRMEGKDLATRVKELARIRDEGGYMAEASGRRSPPFELQEHNCPIRALAEEYGEACEVERLMFQSLLRANVDTTHRVVAGAPVCRFLIRPRKDTTL